MNEWRDDWAQAFGESVGIVAIGFGLLGIAVGRRRSASLSPRRHAWDNVPFGLPDGFDFAAIKKTPSSAFDVLLKRTRGLFELWEAARF